MKATVLEFQIDLDIGDIKQTLKRAALKGQAESVPHGAFRSITSDEIFRRDRLGLTILIGKRRGHAIGILGKALKRSLPSDIFAV